MKYKYASCEGKHRYDSYTEAARGSHMQVYKCRFCNGFHKGTQTGKLPKLRRLKEECA